MRQVVQHKHLGVTFNDRLTWKDHVDTISTKAARKIGFLRRYRKRLPQIVLQHNYYFIQDLNTASTRIRVSRMEWFIDYRKTALGVDPTESGTTDYRRDYQT